MRRKTGFYDRLAHSTRRAAKKIKHDIQKSVPKGKALGVAILFSIAAIVVIGILILSYLDELVGFPGLYEDTRSDDEIARTCEVNEDCVPDSCCHAFRCINQKFAPSCVGIMCTANCQPETMDCGQGYCACTNGLCEAYITNPELVNPS